MRMVFGNGVQIATQSSGSNARGAIVLVMGATASMMWWPEEFVAALATAGYMVIRYDHRDTGRSTTGAPGVANYAVDDLSNDLMSVLDSYGLASAHVVGMSLGGLIAQLTTVKHPDRVKSLTLIASEPLHGGEADLPGIDERFMAHFSEMGTLEWSDRKTVAEFMLETARLSSGSGHAFDARAARTRIDRELDRAINIQSAFNHALMRGDLDNRWDLREIKRPTLVIHGSEDPIIPLANGEAIARQVPGAKLFVLKGSGHELHEADLPDIETKIIEFVAAVDEKAGVQ